MAGISVDPRSWNDMAPSSRRLPAEQISAIFFDLDNTLIQTRRGDINACDKVRSLLIKKYCIGVEDATWITQSFLKTFRRYPESLEVSLEQWRLSLWQKALGSHYQDIAEEICEEWTELRYQHLQPDEDILSMLRCLKSRYYLGLITNGPSRSQWCKIRRLGLETYFHSILVSGDLCWEKPNKGIFLLACEQLNIPPAECIMVGDRLDTDILGAHKAGLGGSVWIPLAETLDENVHITPDVTLPSVLHLPALLTPSSLRLNLNRYLDLSEPESENSNSSESS